MIFCTILDPARTLAVLVLEAAVGYPDRLHRVLPHPVVWAGAAISRLEIFWNRPAWPDFLRRALGVLTVVLVAGCAALLGFAIDRWAAAKFWLFLATIVIGTTGLAQRSLYLHVAAVDKALRAGDLPGARLAVARIVGRDVDSMDAGKIAAAALESLAESFCDGVVAPAFLLCALGLGGLFFYKVVNTADSIIGHREARYKAFGWAAARSDDVCNFVPARLAGCLLALAAGGGWRVMWRDAGKHESPNAGWPEAAMAGGRKIRLGGPVSYDGVAHLRPWFGDGKAPQVADLGEGLKIYRRACFLLWVLLAAGGYVLWRG